MASTDSIKTRILILSDTHGALPYPSNNATSATNNHPYRWPLPKADILLHAGDLTMNGKLEEHENAVALLRGVDAELKIVIPGNHDLTLDREYYQTYPNAHCSWPKYDDSVLCKIENLYTGDEARAAGIVYMVEGTQTFTLKTGAQFTVYASAYQPEFCNWAFGYEREQDRFNLPGPGFISTNNKDYSLVHQQDMKTETEIRPPPNPVPSFSSTPTGTQNNNPGIDIMLTHGPPRNTLDLTSRNEHVGCDHLARAVQRCRPRLHAFGHIHEAAGAVFKVWNRDGNDIEVEEVDPGEEETATGHSASSHGQIVPNEVNGTSYYDASTLEFGAETLFVNASIMSLQYEPVQSPWIVDLMLPRTGLRPAGHRSETFQHPISR